MTIKLKKAQRLSSWNSQKMYLHSKQSYKRKWTVKRGEVYFINLGENIRSEENKIRPCVIIQPNSFGMNSPVTIIAIISNSPMTINDIQIPITETYTYTVNSQQKNLTGTIDLGQIKTIGKERITSSKVATVRSEMTEVNKKLFNAVGLTKKIRSYKNTINSLNGKVKYLKDKISSLEEEVQILKNKN